MVVVVVVDEDEVGCDALSWETRLEGSLYARDVRDVGGAAYRAAGWGVFLAARGQGCCLLFSGQDELRLNRILEFIVISTPVFTP